MRNIRESKEEEDFTTIQENSATSTTTTSMASSNSISSSWSRFKDPRIVRVSRASGGKDRHSKVSTVRGLRDRRVRLSVPTAIQLYDLQERLGLNQPSKVVDWLLSVAKHEIDELPPLQYPAGRSDQKLHQDPAFLEFGVTQYDKQDLNISGSTVDWPRNEEERQFSFGNQGGGPFVVSGANSNPNSQSPYNNQVFRCYPSNVTLSHQMLVYQSGTRPHESHFPSSLDPKQLNFQASHELSVSPITSTVDGSNTSPSVRQSSHFSVTENLLPSENSTQHSSLRSGAGISM